MAVKDRAERADRVHVNLAGVSALAMGHFLGGFLMSAGQLMGKLAPFGVAAVAAVPIPPVFMRVLGKKTFPLRFPELFCDIVF